MPGKTMTLKELRRHLALVLAKQDHDRESFGAAVEEYLSEHEHLGHVYDARVRRPKVGRWRRFVNECWKDYREFNALLGGK